MRDGRRVVGMRDPWEGGLNLAGFSNIRGFSAADVGVGCNWRRCGRRRRDPRGRRKRGIGDNIMDVLHSM